MRPTGAPRPESSADSAVSAIRSPCRHSGISLAVRVRASTRKLSGVPARRRHGKGARSHCLTPHGWCGSEASLDHAGLSPRPPGALVVLGWRGLVGRGRARPGGLFTESHLILRKLFPTGVDRPQSGPGCDRGRVDGPCVHFAAVGLLRGSHPARHLRLAAAAARGARCHVHAAGARADPPAAAGQLLPHRLGERLRQQLRGDEYHEQCRGDALPHRTARGPLSRPLERAGLGDDPANHLGVVDGRQLRVSLP